MRKRKCKHCGNPLIRKRNPVRNRLTASKYYAMHGRLEGVANFKARKYCNYTCSNRAKVKP